MHSDVDYWNDRNIEKSLNFHAILCILTSKMEALKKFEFSRQNCVCMSIFKQTHAMNTFVARFARFARSYLSYLFSCFGCITFKPARKKLFWLLCNNAKAGKSLAKTNKKWVSECGVRTTKLVLLLLYWILRER